MPVQKAKDFKGTFRRLVGYLMPFRFTLITVFAAAIVSTIFSILSPKILGHATTKLFAGIMGKMNGDPNAKIDWHGIEMIIFWLIGLYILSAVFSYIQQYLMAGVAQRTVYKLRNDVNEKLARLPLSFSTRARTARS